MKVLRYIYAVVASMFLLTLSACQVEEDSPGITIDKENCYKLQFGVSILPPQTRATEDGLDPLNENTINTMHAFLYDDSGIQKGFFSTVKGDLVVEPNTQTEGKATIYVPKDPGFNNSYGGKDYTLYVLVNYHGSENLKGLTLDQLKKIRVRTDQMVQSSVAKQNDFLMDGNVKTGPMTWEYENNYNITTTTGNIVKLSRAAAKIRVRLGSISVKDKDQDYDLIGTPMISLKSYLAETSPLAGSPLDQPTFLFMDNSQDMVQAEFEGQMFWARSVPFYSYENDWSDNASKRTYAVIKLHVRGKVDHKESDTYYSIPLNYLVPKDGMETGDVAGIPKLQRNHLYDIECSISELGSAEPTKPSPLDNSYIAVEDWNSPDAIDAAISKAHYLVVKETTPEMLNVSTRLVEYLSDLDIDENELLQSIETEYTEYRTDGTYHTIKGDRYMSQGPITIRPIKMGGKTYLEINSPVPDNYVPLTIKFNVKQKPDNDGSTPLEKKVVVTQYPPIYVTATHSTGERTLYWYYPFASYLENGLGGQSGYQANDVLFKITTLAPKDGQILGDPTNGTEYTGQDDESNKITSPEYIVASQWGMSIPVRQYESGSVYGWSHQGDYALQRTTGIVDKYNDYRYRNYYNAEDRAYYYWEDEYGSSFTNKQFHGDERGYQNRTITLSKTFKYEGRWRIPTEAELRLIVTIQSDPKSAVKSLLWGKAYWSARKGWYYDFVRNKAYEADDEKFPIRPVFDTYNK